MKPKLQTRNILILDTAIILLFSLFLVVSYIWLIEHVNQGLNEIDQKQLSKLEQVREMTRVARLRSELMLNMYIEQDEWKRDELFIEFHNIAGDFILARDRLVELGLEQSEKKLLTKILYTIKQTEVLQTDIVDRIHAGNMNGVHADISRRDLPIELNLLGNLDRLSNTIVTNSQSDRNRLKDRYRSIVLVFELASVLIIAAITMLMLASLRKVGNIEKGLLDKTEILGRDASHDPLTNIYNRRWLQFKIENLFRNRNMKDNTHALLYIDLDSFKPINDDNGHAAGDKYLISFCREVEKNIRHSDTFCRMGGDEFAILLENCSVEDANKVAWNIVSKVARMAIEIDGKKFSTTCSIGLYKITSAYQDFNEILGEADALCYQAKREGKNCVVSTEPIPGIRGAS